MAQLYEGQWLDTAPAAEEIGEDGRFRRIDSPLREWISPDPAARFPAEAGRYHLWVAAVCPWAARTTAFRVLKGLEDVISVSWARPGLPKEGWVFDEITGNRLDFYPEPLRAEIDRWNALIYPTLNNGVYRAGFASTQHAYDEAVGEVFATLDAMEQRLSASRYLCG